MTGSYKDLLYDWLGTNEWLFRQINSIHGDWYDSTMIVLTHIGDRHNFVTYLVLLAAWMTLVLTVRKMRGNAGLKQQFISWVGVFAMLAAGYISVAVVIGFTKNYFAYPRPYIALENVRVLEYNHDRGSDLADDHKSFPSGHVAFTTMMVVALWPVLSGSAGWLGILLIMGVAWSRMALGMHFPADVVGAFLIAYPLAVLVRYIVYEMLYKVLGLRC